MSWLGLSRFKYWPQVLVFLLIVIGYGCYRYFAYYDTRSSDAYVSANIVNMSPLVTGVVTNIYVKDNQKIKKGDKLIEIEPLPYISAAEQAKAKLNGAKLNYEQEQFAIVRAKEQLKQQQLKLALSKEQYARYTQLATKQNIAKITLINLADKIKEQETALVAAMQELKTAQLNFDDNQIIAAQAELQQANYLLSHTVIRAPEDGYVSNFNIRKGQYVRAGESLFALIETKQWWIETRYRETALRLIKPGDKAKVTIDMYPGKVFHGHVNSIGWGINRVQAGNMAASPLVYLEPTEDWIQIAQRFPVRIYIDDLSDDYPLRVGASATTTTYR